VYLSLTVLHQQRVYNAALKFNLCVPHVFNLIPKSRYQRHLVLMLRLVEALSREVHYRLDSKRLAMVLIESTASQKKHHWYRAVVNRKSLPKLSLLLPKK